jgi:hypothetical protein
MASLLTYSAMAFGPKTFLPKYSEICLVVFDLLFPEDCIILLLFDCKIRVKGCNKDGFYGKKLTKFQ